MLLLTPLALEFIEENNRPQNRRLDTSVSKGHTTKRIIHKDAPIKMTALMKFQKVAKLVPSLNKFSKFTVKSSEEKRIPKVDIKSEIQYLLTKIETKEGKNGSYVFKQMESFKRNLSQNLKQEQLEKMVIALTKSEATPRSLLKQQALLSNLQKNAPHPVSLARDLRHLHHISSLQTLQSKKKQAFASVQGKAQQVASLWKASAHDKEVEQIQKSTAKLSQDFNSVLKDNKVSETSIWTAQKQMRQFSKASTHSIKPIRHLRVRGAEGRSWTVKSFVDISNPNNSLSNCSPANLPSDCRKEKSFTDSTHQSELANYSDPRTATLLLPPVRNLPKIHKMLTE